ncbi:MAG: diaminopimelate decarboxylase [Bacteriovoracaceae bacterium]
MNQKAFVAAPPLTYKNKSLYFDGVPLKEIAEKKKTPFYLYSEKTLVNQYKTFISEAKKAGITDHQVCYALKANPNLEILKNLAKLGLGADIVSLGELMRAMQAGIPASKIIFSGVGKTELEINMALKCSEIGVYAFNVESVEELELISQCAQAQNLTARISFRLNPQVHAKTHKNISTGNKTHKFGLLEDDILKAINNPKLWKNCKLVGISIHIGSQLTELKATDQALKKLFALCIKIKQPLEFIDVGGGLGIDYHESQSGKIATIKDYMGLVGKHYKDLINKKVPYLKKPRILFEPGRILMARAGVLVTRVIRQKKSDKHQFVVIDGGMNDLLRPSLYEAYHRILPENFSPKDKLTKYDVVGPICETSDCFGVDRLLPELKTGDLIAIADSGAYGHSMSSNYNLRGKPEEVLLQNGKWITISKGQSYSQY